jgi:hypothetical protein
MGWAARIFWMTPIVMKRLDGEAGDCRSLPQGPLHIAKKNDTRAATRFGLFSETCSHVRFQGAARSFLLRRRGLRRSLVRTQTFLRS